jgi:hypothetical protein
MTGERRKNNRDDRLSVNDIMNLTAAYKVNTEHDSKYTKANC